MSDGVEELFEAVYLNSTRLRDMSVKVRYIDLSVSASMFNDIYHYAQRNSVVNILRPPSYGTMKVRYLGVDILFVSSPDAK